MSVVETARTYRPQGASHADRVILVTGAGDGIGRALALALASHGATVVLSSRQQRKLESTYDAIVAAGGPRPAIAPLNLETAVASDYDRLVEALDKEFGRLDGLAHVGGILGTRSPIEHFDVPLWSKVLHVNLTAAFVMTQVCLPLLKRSADASIVFASSSVGRKGRAYWGAYAVSKFGVEGLSQVLAHELADSTKVRVNTVNPGATRTQMRLQAYPGEDPAKLPAPGDVLAPFLFLLGPASTGVTGEQFESQPLPT